MGDGQGEVISTRYSSYGSKISGVLESINDGDYCYLCRDDRDMPYERVLFKTLSEVL